MKNPALPLPAEIAEALEAGVTLGQSRAFGLVAGRCSAAQAEGLQRLRDEKKYLKIAPTWRDFCRRYLNISGTQADRVIHLWQEFGAGYFEIAQLTRISPETYRAIQPSLRDGAIHLNGEAIALDPENAHKVAAAVAELRRGLPAPEPAHDSPIHEHLDTLEKRSEALERRAPEGRQ